MKPCQIFPLLAILLLVFPAPMPLGLLDIPAMADPSAANDEEEQHEEEDEGPRSELEELGMVLKAAVISGNMTEEEGWAIWHTAVAQAKGEDGEQDEKEDEEYDDTNGNHRIGRLVPPDPTEPAMLLEPEFLPRDVQLLSNRLDLDNQRTIIVEMIIRDYGDSFEAMTSGLPPAIKLYKQAEHAREMQQMLTHLENEVLQRHVDMDSAARVIEEKVRGYAEKTIATEASKNGGDDADVSEKVDGKTAEWTGELTHALQNMNEQMSLLRDRMKARVDTIKQPEGEVTSRDLVQMAEEIGVQRANLRQDAIEMLTLALVVDDDAEDQARLDDALARLQVEHGLRHARMGGEFINPWSLARDIEPEDVAGSVADDVLTQQQDILATLVTFRSDAAVLREIEALRLMVARDDLVAIAGDEDNVPLETWYEVLEPFTEAWHAQVDASVVYRDSVLDLVEQTKQTLAETDLSLANQYQDEAMRRGFGSEMRTRWSERALKAALALEDLDEETQMVLLTLEEETGNQLRIARMKAIDKRLKRDPELAHKPVLSLWSLDDSQGKPWISEDWTGHEMESHQRINGQVESSLQALLTPEQFESIPRRRSRNNDGKGQAGKRTTAADKGA